MGVTRGILVVHARYIVYRYIAGCGWYDGSICSVAQHLGKLDCTGHLGANYCPNIYLLQKPLKE